MMSSNRSTRSSTSSIGLRHNIFFQLEDPKLADASDELIKAHLVIICLTVLGSLLTIITLWVVDSTVDDLPSSLREKGGIDEETLDSDQNKNYVMTAVISFGAIVVLFVVGLAIQINSLVCMQLVCIVDGVCCCFFVLWALAMINAIHGTVALAHMVSTHCPTEMHKCEEDTAQNFQDKAEGLKVLFGITALLLCINACACCNGAVYAMKGSNDLRFYMVFPEPPPQSMSMSLPQPTVEVVGRPVLLTSGHVTEGQPVRSS
eukprot:gnl/TRDRNA2_/TRDRNA2_30702_c0_seq1.p1 gnl/TRDRNA2_/TRDRNA2_30702_c0~~gnl/TRDRNA2_/TRDRNA2_30702_c0_seq1.p1  ORF type:complete len:261 (-),score=31.93 gnl/TRDRNA2_/TRDRNA2_30702_c0_seq1:141-923(-)